MEQNTWNSNLKLNEYAQFCAKILGVNSEQLIKNAESAIDYFSGNKKKRDEIRATVKLEQAWYESLKNGLPDFSLYDNEEMLADTWACWKLYSKNYIKLLDKPLPTGEVLSEKIKSMSSICDLGCGPGITTMCLKQKFNSLLVQGTQRPESKQFKIASELGKIHGFDVNENPTQADFVFASEYFEHFERPLEHLREVLTSTKCKMIMFANAFGALAVGHFNVYIDGEKIMSSKEVGRKFNVTLMEFGFKRIKTGFWNNRPNVFERI